MPLIYKKKNKNLRTVNVPGALEVKQTHTFEIVTGISSNVADLESAGFQFRHAKALYEFITINVPAGIYKKFVLLVLKHDIGCNNYIADRLKIKRKEMKIKHDGALYDRS